MISNRPQYEFIITSDSPQDLLAAGTSDSDERLRETRSSRKTSKPPKSWYSMTLRRFHGRKNWRFGLFAGLYASLAVLISNIILLLFGALTHDGVKDGVATILSGDMKAVSRTSTAVHILINVLSTALLTSSNYAMQVLCAPSRYEIDKAHRKGLWLEIGLMSFRNLSNIDRRRRILWWLLALSSAPLHLFYNSAVFQVTSGQDYSITALTGSDQPPGPDWRYLSNSEWMHTYKDEYVSGYSDLALVMKMASSRVIVENDWSFSFNSSSSDNCDWLIAQDGEEIDVPAEINITSKSLLPSRRETYRVIFPLGNGSAFNFTIHEQRPTFDNVYVPERYTKNLNICAKADGTSWLVKPSNVSLRVEYAYAKERPYGCKVQIGLPFLIVVIVANIVKIACIFRTLSTCSSGHNVTVGDAVASFLEHPDPVTKSKCMQTQAQLLENSEEAHSDLWEPKKKYTISIIGGKRFTIMILVCFVSLILCALLSLLAYGGQRDWGTASKLIFESSKSDFNARGTLLAAFLANLPQVLLSVFYFSVNRICTSICFAREWNQYGTRRKGLRVTSPEGEQRPTHFLQLPIRFAAPLTIWSGMLHWLLSQSFFLVRLETRTREDELYPSSLCVCGYSVLSYVAFTGALLVLIAVVVVLLAIKVDVRIPPAQHCSLSISAACHPPNDDIEGYLKQVQWGVVEGGIDGEHDHYTFTSLDVKAPVKDASTVEVPTTVTK